MFHVPKLAVGPEELAKKYSGVPPGVVITTWNAVAPTPALLNACIQKFWKAGLEPGPGYALEKFTLAVPPVVERVTVGSVRVTVAPKLYQKSSQLVIGPCDAV
jgi:hypothetical protein